MNTDKHLSTLLAILILFILGCSSDENPISKELLYGEWRINSVNGVEDGYNQYQVYLNFQKNGTITLCSEDVCIETLWEFVSGSSELLELSNSNYLFFSDNTLGLINRPVEFVLIKSINPSFLSIDVIKNINGEEVDKRSVELSK